jgi:hypothetical protein
LDRPAATRFQDPPVDVGRQNLPPETAGEVENLVPLRSEALNERPGAAEN